MRGTPRAAHIATVASLTRWKQKLRGITFATGPSRIGLPNPVLIGRTLLVSTFSPRIDCRYTATAVTPCLPPSALSQAGIAA